MISNVVLGNQPNNNKNVEPQLLKRFLCHNFVTSVNPPELFNSELIPLLSKFNPREVGSCLQSLQSNGDSTGKVLTSKTLHT